MKLYIGLAAVAMMAASALGQTPPGIQLGLPASTMPLPGAGADATTANEMRARSSYVLKCEFTPQTTEARRDLGGLRALTNKAPDDWSIPEDWSDYNFLVMEFRASSSERFQLSLFAHDGPDGSEVMASKRIGPMQGAWVRAAIPLEFFRKPAREGFDLAATFNKHRDSYWININFGGWMPCQKVTAIGFQMDGPIPVNGQPPTLEVRSIKLAKADPGDAVLEPAKVVDPFGQWMPADWPGKAHSVDDLKKAWAAEDAALTPGDFGYDKYGGYDVKAGMDWMNRPATGFFHVDKILHGGGGGPPGSAGGQSWFIDPDGHLFYSAGVNGIGTASATTVNNRQQIFEALPAAGPRGGGGGANFYGSNLQLRLGADFTAAWGALTYRRMEAWGFNTVAGFAAGPNPAIALHGNRKPYTAMLRNWAGANAVTVMGMPDVYSPQFEQAVDQAAAVQCDPLKSDPYLLGYFVGNEPPWPGRESLFCDAVLAGAGSGMKSRLQDYLKQGDAPQRRRQFVYDAFDRYLSVIVAAIKRHDPNHLTLGIRLGGEVPDEVIKACSIFDVCSINVYDFAIDPAFLGKVAQLTARPIIVGEFHFGTPGHGMGGGLRQVASQKDRGLAYAYYVEHAAAHPAVIGTHWFQWIDQPATGRNDGENYNIGLIDVTDQPYADMVAVMAQTHQRLFNVHMGTTPPTETLPEGRSTAEIQLAHPAMIPPAQ